MPVTWEQIRSQFTQEDIKHMRDATGKRLDLSNCQSTKAMANQIYQRVNANNMPPPDQQRPWSEEWKQNFKDWMDAGCPCD